MSALAEQTPKNQISLLIVQMGEEAEVFRALMAMKAIKHLYPDSKINIIVRREVSSAVKRVDWISSVIETPQFAVETAHKDVALWIDRIIDENYDILVNWTFTEKYSRLAAITTSLIPAVIKLGDYVREDSSIASFDAWAMYRHAWIRGKVEQDIHTTDIITTQLLTALQIHAGDPSPEAGASAVTSRYFFKSITASIPMIWATRAKNLKWIAVEPQSLPQSASHDWIDSILRRHPDSGIVFLSKPRFAVDVDGEFKSRIMVIDEPLCTDDTIHLFSQIQWLISGKSHLVDLASLMNLRVVYIPDQFVSVDGPYGNGHLIIEKANSNAIYAIWSYFHSEWFHKGTFSLAKHFENLSCASSMEHLTVYRSRIRPSQEGGGVSFEKIVPDTFSFDTWMSRVRGQMARAWFCGWLPSIEAEVATMRLSPILVKRVRELQESVKVLEKLCHEGKAVANLLLKNTENLRSGKVMSVEDRTSIEECGVKLLEVENLMGRVAEVDPELKCIINFYKVLMHNLNGTTLSQMAKESSQAFELIDEGVEIISIYIQKTLDFAKPKSIAPSTVQEIQKEIQTDKI